MSDDPLDLLDDDGDGVVEMCLIEEQEKLKRSGGNKSSGCCVVFLILGSSLILAGYVGQFILSWVTCIVLGKTMMY